MQKRERRHDHREPRSQTEEDGPIDRLLGKHPGPPRAFAGLGPWARSREPPGVSPVRRHPDGPKPPKAP
jgi:hypothetical protein